MVSGDIYKTKYVTWNNFGLEKNDKDLYAYQLMADIYNQIGIHDGTMTAYHQTQMNNSDSQTYLDGIEQLQYDILYGERYCYDGDINKYPATEIIMGIDEVVISEVSPYIDEEGTEWISLKGSGFTQWSHVYVNDDEVDTTYISGNELWIKASKLSADNSFIVKQLGSSNSVFRVSNDFFYNTPTTYSITETSETTD